MDLSVIVFLGLLLAVALLRLVELRISRRHQREMTARGAADCSRPMGAFAHSMPRQPGPPSAAVPDWWC